MKLFLSILFICFISYKANCQQNDSSYHSTEILEKNNSSGNSSENLFLLRLNSFELNQMSYFPDNSLPLNLNLPVNNLNDQTIFYHNLYLSSAAENNLLNYNRNKMMSSFYGFYEQTRPTKMQKVLGMVQISGAAFLAGYHIYKYYIKKKD
ncbi:MAG: hypothetical protein ACM34K_21130 [Bacillota bacterium]